MGRRPNPVVFNFFHRGAKLQDSSNRYEHVCRRCGVTVAKGRVEALLAHILERCPQASSDDRQLVVEYVQRQGHTNTDVRKIGARKDLGAPATSLTVTNYALDPTLPSGFGPYESDLPLLQREQSALDALAEISRQQLDASADQRQQPRPSSPDQSHNFPLSDQSHREHRAQDEDRLGAALRQPLEDGEMTWSATSVNGVNGINDVSAETASAPTASSFGILQKPVKGRAARGRFTEDRRKQVSEVRKQGACIRCRMLKKPCSDGTPCRTCSGVESARLWKTSCVRTRVADEFTLWSTNLFHSRAVQDVPAAVRGLSCHPIPGRLEIRLVPACNTILTCATRRYFKSATSHGPGPVDVSSHLADVEAPLDLDNDIVLIDEGEGFTMKLESYLDAAKGAAIEAESNALIKATLRQAQALLDSESQQIGSDKPEHRPCYNFQRSLVGNAIDLWLQTTVLCGREIAQLRLNPTARPQLTLQPKDDGVDDEDGRGIGVDGVITSQLLAAIEEDGNGNRARMQPIPSGSKSYSMITAQLLAAIETRSAKLSKLVMNELERRVLQRQQVSGFATLLTAVLLLHCAERMSHMYHGFDTAEATAAGWPLDKQPASLWPQGERFADLVVMLLKMRGLPPRTTATAGDGDGDGDDSRRRLVVATDWFEGEQAAFAAGHALRIELAKAAVPWLDPLGLDLADLQRRCDTTATPAGDDGGGERAWDLRFVAKLLLSPGPAAD